MNNISADVCDSIDSARKIFHLNEYDIIISSVKDSCSDNFNIVYIEKPYTADKLLQILQGGI